MDSNNKEGTPPTPLARDPREGTPGTGKKHKERSKTPKSGGGNDTPSRSGKSFQTGLTDLFTAAAKQAANTAKQAASTVAQMVTIQADVSQQLYQEALRKQFFRSYRGIGLNKVSDEALEDKKALEEQFQEHEIDYEVARKQKINPFKSSLLDIGHRSEGLAGYVLTTRFMIMVVFIYSLLAIYSMWDYSVRGDRFIDTFELQLVDTRNRVIYQETCPKFWRASTTFSKFSLGSFCQRDSKYTGPMTCGAKCVRKVDPADAYTLWSQEYVKVRYKDYFKRIDDTETFGSLYPDDRSNPANDPLTATPIWSSASLDLSAVFDPERPNRDAELSFPARDLLSPNGKCLANIVETYLYYVANNKTVSTNATLTDGLRRLSYWPLTTVAELLALKRASKSGPPTNASWLEPRGVLTLDNPLNDIQRAAKTSSRIEQLLGWDKSTRQERTLLLLDKLNGDGQFKNASTSLCFQIMPCIGRFDHGPDSPDGMCHCCELQPLQKQDFVGTTDPKLLDLRLESPFNMWMQLLLTFLYAGCWAIWRYYMIALPIQMDESKITASDFAVVVEPIQITQGWDNYDRLQRDLREYARHWGAVAVATPTVNLGGFVEFCERKSVLLRKMHELEARVKYGDSVLSSPVTYLYKLLFGGGLIASTGLVKVKEELKSLDDEIEKYGEQYKVETLGQGLIIFNDLEAANRFMDDHNPNPLVETLAHIPVFGRKAVKKLGILPIFESGDFQTVFYARTAPEPADILWGSVASKHSKFTAGMISVSMDFAALFLVLCSAAWQFGMELVKRRELLKKADAEMIYKSPGGEPETSASGIRTQLVTTGISVGITIANLVMIVVLRVLSKLQGRLTKTEQQQSLLWKLCLLFILNNFVIPVAASTIDRRSRWSWYSVGGLATQAVTIQISNAIVPTLIAALNPMGLLKRNFMWKFARSQAMVDFLLQPDEFVVAVRLAKHFKTVALGILFAPIMPISPWIALIALVVGHMNDLHQIHNTIMIDTGLKMDVVRSLFFSVPLIPLTQLFFVGLAYFQHRHDSWKFLVVSGCCWVLLFIVLPLLPWRYFWWKMQGADENVQKKRTLEEMVHCPYFEFYHESREHADYEPDITLCANVPSVLEMKHRIDGMFDLPSRPYPPNFEKLPGQDYDALPEDERDEAVYKKIEEALQRSKSSRYHIEPVRTRDDPSASGNGAAAQAGGQPRPKSRVQFSETPGASQPATGTAADLVDIEAGVGPGDGADHMSASEIPRGAAGFDAKKSVKTKTFAAGGKSTSSISRPPSGAGSPVPQSPSPTPLGKH